MDQWIHFEPVEAGRLPFATNAKEQAALHDCLEAFSRWIEEELIGTLAKAGLPCPLALQEILVQLQSPTPSLLKRAFLWFRRQEVSGLEDAAQKTQNPDILASLEERRRVLDSIVSASLFQETPAHPPLHLTQFLTFEAAQSLQKMRPLLPRQYDEVFHLVNAASLFLPDLAYFREQCGARGLSLVVASLDIDNLRGLNQRYGNATITRELLPSFLSTIEAHLFGRGQVYGFGRDDYSLLLPNTDESSAVILLASLQEELKKRTYRAERYPTISIGCMALTEDSWLSEQEVLSWVEKAKRHAKNPGGKDCIAVASSASLSIVWPR